MPSDIKVTYPTLASVATQFSNEASRIDQTLQNLGQQRSQLQNKWIGQGAQKFFQEMDTSVLPEFRRLEKALTATSVAVKDISQIFQTAEQEATRMVQVQGQGAAGTGEGPGAAGPGGGPGVATPTEDPGGGGGGKADKPRPDLNGLSDAEAEKVVEDILKQSALGRAAVAKADELGLKFKLSTAGGGSYLEGDTIYIDPNNAPDNAAGVYMHELTHAQQLWPDINTSTRADYVDKCISNEADAAIARLRYQMQNPEADRLNNPPYEKPYWDAYNKKCAELINANPAISPDELERQGNAAGKAEVEKAFRDGSVVTSTTGETYADYYGGAWDDAHPPAP